MGDTVVESLWRSDGVMLEGLVRLCRDVKAIRARSHTASDDLSAVIPADQ